MTIGGKFPDGSETSLPSHGQPTAGQFPAAGAPPGWYPDPAGAPLQRYFDGKQWTDQLAPGPATPPASPPGPQGRKRGLVVLAGAVVAAMLVGGSVLAYQHIQRSAADQGPCPVKGARPLMMAKKDPAEPTIVVPANEGWDRMQRSDFPASAEQLDSPLIRGIVVNRDLAANGFAPNAVVTLERYTDGSTVEEIARQEAAPLRQLGTVTGPTPARVCGQDGFRTDIAGLNGGKVTSTEVLTTVEGHDGVRWVAVVTLQTTEPDNPGFVAQRDALLQGLRLEVSPHQT